MLICLNDQCSCIHHRLLDCLKRESKSTEVKLILRTLENIHNLVSPAGWTLLHYAAYHDNEVIVHYLIEIGCDINARNIDGFTPLMLSIINQQLTIIDLLLKSNAEIYGPGNALELAAGYFLDWISKSKDSVTVPWTYERILIKIFDKINLDLEMDPQKTQELLLSENHYVRLTIVAIGNIELSRLLLENGYPVDHYSPKYGTTALHCSIIMSKPQNATLLIDFGADVKLLDMHGKSAIYYYLRECQYADRQAAALKSLLKNYVITPELNKLEELVNLLQYGNKQTVKAVLESDVMNFEECRSLLLVLCRNQNDDVLDIIDELVFRIDINKRIDIEWSSLASMIRGISVCNDTKGTILVMAAHYHREKQIEFLLMHGANPQYIYDRESYVIEYLFQKNNIRKLTTAHLALIKVVKKSRLTHFISSAIASRQDSKIHFDLCTKQLEEMKSIHVYGTLTLFKLLSESDNKIITYVHNEEFILAFNKVIEKNSHLERYYLNFLRKRIDNAKCKRELYEKMVLLIEVLTGLCSDAYRIIVYRIASYLSFQDYICLSKL